MRRHHIQLASAPFSLPPPFGEVWLGSVCRVQRLATKQNGEFTEVGENSGPILTRLWTKVHEIFRRGRRPLVFCNALIRFSMSRFVQKIFAIKSQSHRKTEQNML